ncbi:nuclear transport factor 2 family protein [Streptomyces sp. NPDC001401]|uniref:nuclear transport factor 2 family protein n=1 Tax=Streptomyces sp. NPDC001401 TaxID=3364570 RepID=UPI00368D5FF8
MATLEQQKEATPAGARLPDMARFIDFLEARKAETENPKHAAMIDLLIEHSVAEVRDHDIDRTMATLVEDCVYHNYGDPVVVERQGGRVIDSDAVRANYIANMANGALEMDGLEVEVEHFFINDDAIAWDGYTRVRLPGAVLAEEGVPLPDGGTVDDVFVQTSRAVIVIPFRDGLMVGEDFYLDGGGTLEKAASGSV